MQADYVLDYDVVAAARENQVYLLARIKAGPPPADQQRRPLNIGVVLDRSGSMGGDKIMYVKKATQFLIKHLGASDTFSLTIYDDKVEVLVKPEPPNHKDRLNQTIDSITARNMTNLSGGWLQGCQLVEQSKAEGQVDRVILLSDGLANQGITDPNRLKALARQKREEGITTTCMGVGMDFNEDLLAAMAAEGGGAFYFIDDPDQAPAIFSEELTDLLSVVGQNLVITLIPTGDVRMVRQLNNYPVEKGGGEIAFRMGDIFADEIKSLAIELTIPAMAELGQVQVATLRFDYDELVEDTVTHRTVELPIMINIVSEAEAEGRVLNDEAAEPVLLLKAAQAREEAVKRADQGEYDQAKEILTGIADEMEQTGLGSDNLRSEHDMLREEAVDMEFGNQRYDAYSRKSTSSKVAYAAMSRGMRMQEQTVQQHGRMKASRGALERNGETPSSLIWLNNTLDLDGDMIRIGRDADNDIVLDDEEVSAEHCQIVRDGDDLILEDLGSTNGTFANGGRVVGRFRLSVGDVMTVGGVLFRFTTNLP